MAQLIELDRLTPAQESAWRELSGRVAEPNPFFEPDALLAAHGHLRRPGVALLVTETSDGWTACLPIRSATLGGVPVALRSWTHIYAFFGMPLVDRQDPVRALGELLQAAVRQHSSGVVILDQLPSDGPIASSITQALANSRLAILKDARLERAALRRRSAGGYFDHAGRHHQREANRLGRRLGDVLGAPLTVRDRAADPGAVDAFLRLEASGWKGREGTAMSCRPSDAAFFSEMCDRFRAQGRLQLLALESGDHTVAMKCNLAAGDGLFCFKIAQDDELNRFSPGVQLERLNVDVFHEQRGEAWMDSCAAESNQMINRLWPDRRSISNIVIGRRDLLTGLSASVFRTAVGVRRRVRRLHTDWRTTFPAS